MTGRKGAKGGIRRVIAPSGTARPRARRRAARARAPSRDKRQAKWLTICLTVHSGRRVGGNPVHRKVWIVPAGQGRTRKRERADADHAHDQACLILSALGHRNRVRILESLLAGAVNYRELQQTCRLQPGPFYHHVGELRLAGLISTKERDTYEVAPAGMDAVGVLLMAATCGRRQSRDG